MRDPSVPVHAACLAALTLASAVVPASSFLPTTPAGLAAALLAWTALWCGVVLPCTTGAGPGRVLSAALVAAVPLAFALRAAPGTLLVPWPVPAAGLAFGWLATSLPPGPRGRVAACAAVVLTGLPLLREADVLGTPPPAAASILPSLPVRPLEVRDTTADGRPADPIEGVPLAWRVPDPGTVRRIGALARTPDGAADGPAALPLASARWMPVPALAAGAWPAGGALLRVVGGTFEGPVGPAGDPVAVTGPWRPVEALDLDPYDALVLAEEVPEDDASAAVLAGFARRGGLLVAADDAGRWPPALGRALGAAARTDDAGPSGAHAFGAGRVARVRATREVAALLDRGLHVPRAATAFDRATQPPATPAAFRPAPRGIGRPEGAVLAAAWAAATGLLAWSLRGPVRFAGLVVLAAAGVGAALLVTPPETGVRATPFVVEVGGTGGRRVAGIHVTADAAGWVGPRVGDLESSAGLRSLGFQLLRFEDGLRLALRPHGAGWILEEGVARETVEGLRRIESAPDWALPLLRPGGAGEEQARLWSGSVRYDGPRPPGVRLPDEARALLIRP